LTASFTLRNWKLLEDHNRPFSNFEWEVRHHRLQSAPTDTAFHLGVLLVFKSDSHSFGCPPHLGSHPAEESASEAHVDVIRPVDLSFANTPSNKSKRIVGNLRHT